MPLKVIGFDGGHEIEKFNTPRAEGSFRHAMHQITEADYDYTSLRNNGKPPADYIKVNGTPYVIGEMAEDFGPVTKKVGAARYKPEYIGVMFASALARAYDTGGEVEVIASHPSRDITFRDQLIDALIGTWNVECEGRQRVYEVIKASAYDEPAGGLYNVMLTEDGKAYQSTDITDARTLVLDCGGGTVGMIAANPGGWIDYGFRPDTLQLGIADVLRDFETALRDDFATEFIDATVLRPERMREALATGVYKGGGEELPVHRQASAAKNRLLNQISQQYQRRAGGPRNWDAIVLTGGGTAMLYGDLLPILNHKRVFTAGALVDIHMANVRGLRKIRNFYKAVEAINEPTN